MSSSPAGVAAASPASLLSATSFMQQPSGGSLLAEYLADPSRVSSQKQLAEVASAAAAVAAAAASAAVARAPQQRQQWQSDSAVSWEPRDGLLYPAPQRQRQRPQQLNYSGPVFHRDAGGSGGSQETQSQAVMRRPASHRPVIVPRPISARPPSALMPSR